MTNAQFIIRLTKLTKPLWISPSGVNRHFFLRYHIRSYMWRQTFLLTNQKQGFWCTAKQVPFLQYHIEKKKLVAHKTRPFFTVWLLGFHNNFNRNIRLQICIVCYTKLSWYDDTEFSFSCSTLTIFFQPIYLDTNTHRFGSME